MRLKRKDLLGIEDLTRDELELILSTAASFKEICSREIKKVPTLRGKTVINLFYEPSTRTRTSFEIAAKRMSADAVNISASTSSVVKGQTLKGPARTTVGTQALAPVTRPRHDDAPRHRVARVHGNDRHGEGGAGRRCDNDAQDSA